jgi:hypothetical protein
MLKVTADNCPSAYLSIIALEMFTNKLYPTGTQLSMGALVNFPLTLEIGALDVHQKPWRSRILVVVRYSLLTQMNVWRPTLAISDSRLPK